MTNPIKNETVNTMAESAVILTRTIPFDVTSLKNDDLKASLSNIATLTASGQKVAWKIAKEYANIVNNETFKEDFKTLNAFANKMNIAKSTLTTYCKAVEFKEEHPLLLDNEITVRRAYEYSTIDYSGYKAFITVCGIKATSDKEVQKTVKLFKDFTAWLNTTKQVVGFNVKDINDCAKVRKLFETYSNIIEAKPKTKAITTTATEKEDAINVDAKKHTDTKNVEYMVFTIEGTTYKVPVKILNKYAVKESEETTEE